MRDWAQVKYEYVAYVLVFCGSLAFADDTPSADFLEFLGEWEVADGEWVPPAEVAKMEIPTAKHEKETKEVKDDE